MNAFVVRLRAAPPALLVALIGSVLSTALTIYARLKWLDVADRNEQSFDNYARLMMADTGLTFASRAMVVGGIVTAAAVSVRARTLLLVAAGLTAAMALYRAAGWPLVPLLFDDPQKGFERAGLVDMVFGVGGFAALLLLIVAAVRSPVMPVYAALAVIGGLVMSNLPMLGEALREALHEKFLLGTVVFAIAELVLIVGIAGLLGAILHDHPPLPEPRVAALGLKRMERGLLIKAVMPLVLFAAALMGARSMSSLKFVLLGGVVALVFAWIIIGAGAITLVRSRLEGSRRRGSSSARAS